MSSFTPEEGRRPENIQEFLVQEYEREQAHVVFDRVQMIKKGYEYRTSRSIDTTSVLALICADIGSQTLHAIREEYPRTVSLHPVHPTFQDLTQADQRLVVASLGTIAMRPAVLGLQDVINTQQPWFNYQEYALYYNEKIQGISTSIDYMNAFKDDKAIFDASKRREHLHPVQLDVLSRLYNETHMFDFGDPNVWESLPFGLRRFWIRNKLAPVIQNELAPAFVKRIKEIRHQEIPSWFREGLIDIDMRLE